MHEAWHTVLWIQIGCRVNIVKVKPNNIFNWGGFCQQDRDPLNYCRRHPSEYNYNEYCNIGIYAPHVITTLAPHLYTFDAMYKTDKEHWNCSLTDIDLVKNYLLAHFDNPDKAYDEFVKLSSYCREFVLKNEKLITIVKKISAELENEDQLCWNQIKNIAFDIFANYNWPWVIY